MAFIRKVKTASGATAIQIAHKKFGRIVWIEHIGSAHTEANLETLLALARQRILGAQFSLLTEPAPPMVSSILRMLKYHHR